MSYELVVDNCDLTETFKNSLRDKMETLLDVSPSDSGVVSNISKTVAGYLWVLQIVSSQGKFTVSTVGHDLDEMLKALFALMHRQLKRWRSARFL